MKKSGFSDEEERTFATGVERPVQVGLDHSVEALGGDAVGRGDELSTPVIHEVVELTELLYRPLDQRLHLTTDPIKHGSFLSGTICPF